MTWLNSTHVGDCRQLLANMIADGVKAQTCVTSPPYWGLRDYGVDGQIGMESTLDLWVSQMVDVFRLVRDVLADDGTLWLNLGDAYANGTGGDTYSGFNSRWDGSSWERGKQSVANGEFANINKKARSGLKPKDLLGMPWRVAFALQADGWYLRSDIIWHKPNPMPESVTDRPTKAHEYLFLLAKSSTYYYDAEAIKEDAVTDDLRRPYGSPGANALDGREAPQGNGRPRKTWAERKADGEPMRRGDPALSGHVTSTATLASGYGRNRRTVWTVSPKPQPEAHFACFPPELIEPCILAGAPAGGIVLDPFMGSGTTARVASSLGRQFIGCELNPAYSDIQDKIGIQAGMAL